MPHVGGDEPANPMPISVSGRMPHVGGDEPGDDCVAIYNMNVCPT